MIVKVVKTANCIIIYCLILTCSTLHPNIFTFIPPKSWKQAQKDINELGVYKGKKSFDFTPTMILSAEKTGSIKLTDYIANVEKHYSEKLDFEYITAGCIETRSGTGRQVFLDTNIGSTKIRLIQFFFPFENYIYIITTSIKRRDFLKYYPVINKSLKSVEVTKDIKNLKRKYSSG